MRPAAPGSVPDGMASALLVGVNPVSERLVQPARTNRACTGAIRSGDRGDVIRHGIEPGS